MVATSSVEINDCVTKKKLQKNVKEINIKGEQKIRAGGVKKLIKLSKKGREKKNRFLRKTSKLRKNAKASDEEYDKCLDTYQQAKIKLKLLLNSAIENISLETRGI